MERGREGATHSGLLQPSSLEILAPRAVSRSWKGCSLWWQRPLHVTVNQRICRLARMGCGGRGWGGPSPRAPVPPLSMWALRPLQSYASQASEAFYARLIWNRHAAIMVTGSETAAHRHHCKAACAANHTPDDQFTRFNRSSAERSLKQARHVSYAA